MIIDYEGGLSVAQLKAHGVTGVLRYVGYASWRKSISVDEYRSLEDAGIDIALIWEYDATDFLQSVAKAHVWADVVLPQLEDLAYRGPLYISCDTDLSRREWDATGAAYLHAWDQLWQRDLGVYGSSDVLQWALDDNAADRFWQAGLSRAWSHGRNALFWPHANLVQSSTSMIEGVPVDVNTIGSGTWTNNVGPVFGGDGLVTHWVTVSQGSSGQAVRVAQGLLIARGYWVGSKDGLPDGQFGPACASSTRLLQSSYAATHPGFPVDGIFGPRTACVAMYDRDYVG